MDNIDNRLEMIFEEKRLESFQNWPFKTKSSCNKEVMAEAGFFWIGTTDEPDSVQCFVCNKQLNGWEETDNPWNEHKKHSSECSFVKIGKTEENLTLLQFQELWIDMVRNIAKKIFSETVKKITEEHLKIKDDILNNQLKQ